MGRPRCGPGAKHVRPLRGALGLIVAFLFVQVIVGLATGSLAVLSDAGHMATDALGLGMALAAIPTASSGRVRTHRTFGLYRLEILAALANAVLLFAVAGYVVVEAARRLQSGCSCRPRRSVSTSRHCTMSLHTSSTSSTFTTSTSGRSRLLLAERHSITHATLQIEPDDHLGCDEVSW